MPPLTRWFIKSALVYLVVSLLTGVALAAQSVIALPTAVSVLLNVGVVPATLSPIVGDVVFTPIGRLAEASAAVAVAVHAWRRIRAASLERRPP